jgi:hypothetical protein
MSPDLLGLFLSSAFQYDGPQCWELKMPVAANPLKRDFYVYQFEVDGYPFYIGIGRSTRADDRLRYVRSLSKAKLAKKCLSVRVMAALDQHKDIKLRKPMQHLTRRQALDQEQRRMARLIKKGFLPPAC